MKVIESSPVGDAVLLERETLLVGVSINNSYFSMENLQKLLIWAASSAKSVKVMFPDEPAVHTLVACGYSYERALSESRKKINNLCNKYSKIVKEYNLSNVSMVLWEDFRFEDEYLDSLAFIKCAYQEDLDFRKDIRTTTAEVLSNALARNPTELELHTGVQFLLEEIAFIAKSPDILREKKVAYVYHKTVRVLKRVLETQYRFEPSRDIGFITVE